jgi:hypothetical protein
MVFKMHARAPHVLGPMSPQLPKKNNLSSWAKRWRAGSVGGAGLDGGWPQSGFLVPRLDDIFWN